MGIIVSVWLVGHQTYGQSTTKLHVKQEKEQNEFAQNEARFRASFLSGFVFQRFWVFFLIYKEKHKHENH